VKLALTSQYLTTLEQAYSKALAEFSGEVIQINAQQSPTQVASNVARTLRRLFSGDVSNQGSATPPANNLETNLGQTHPSNAEVCTQPFHYIPSKPDTFLDTNQGGAGVSTIRGPVVSSSQTSLWLRSHSAMAMLQMQATA